MDCKICELKQRQFYCETCIRTHLRDLRRQTQHFSIDRDEQVARATRSLESVAPARIRRANVSLCQQQLEEIITGLSKLRKENDKKRDRLRLLRETLATRRRNISAAKLHSTSYLASSTTATPAPPLQQAASRERQELNALSSTISRARSGLVQELVEVFNIVEVGGRPPIGGKLGTKGEWTIGNLTLPVPGDMRRYPPDHINAVITNTIHFLSLLTFYLGIKLPFEVSWSSGRLGVGQPWIGAGKGSEAGGWARWTSKYCLHVSASVAPTTTIPPSYNNSRPSKTPESPSSPQSYHVPSSLYTRPLPLSTSPSGQSMAESTYYEELPPSASGMGGTSFMTALAMLIYNVTYLAFTQNVDIPLSQAGDVLSNLWRVCCSSELGRRSHETMPLLPPPTPATFPLEFAQLLQATTAKPTSRAPRGKSKTSSSPSLPPPPPPPPPPPTTPTTPVRTRPERTLTAPPLTKPSLSGLGMNALKNMATGHVRRSSAAMMNASIIRHHDLIIEEDEDEEGWNLVDTRGDDDDDDDDDGFGAEDGWR
ncbi:hypothetical protein AMATHDRAFT_87715 [Amanita thiersii Skay4041]|uniref:Autophagy-related protein 14 n=1 Tax=Amanita thiersii Skay4041 TaxID=703135 RepID=A0A2A9NID4_9AGAR|nr:hypothetical protein AMATHDRAFT_87715 [Amanita thiersii Skay4041]